MEDKITKRLALAKSLVRKDSVVFDIGADNGMLSIALFKSGFKVYACENKRGPYNNLKRNVDENSCDIKCLFSSGIDILPDDVDTLLLLGMGGDTIFNILSKDINKLSQIKDIIISPQSDFFIPFKFLYENSFKDDQGLYFKETRIYPLLRFTRSKGEFSLEEEEIQYGYYPLKNKDMMLYEYLTKRYDLFTSLDKTYQDKHRQEIDILKRGLKRYE